MSIEESREKIDRIDKELIALIKKRMEVVREIANQKEESNLPIEDKDREKIVLERVFELSADYKTITESIFKDLINYSKIIQYKGNTEAEKDTVCPFVFAYVVLKGKATDLAELVREFSFLSFTLNKITIKTNAIGNMVGKKNYYKFKLEFVASNISQKNIDKLSYFDDRVDSVKVVKL